MENLDGFERWWQMEYKKNNFISLCDDNAHDAAQAAWEAGIEQYIDDHQYDYHGEDA
jgi:tryptophanyl-tRNA synthetase